MEIQRCTGRLTRVFLDSCRCSSTPALTHRNQVKPSWTWLSFTNHNLFRQTTSDRPLSILLASLATLLLSSCSVPKWVLRSSEYTVDIKIFHQSTVELEPRDRNRKTPLDLAAKHGHQDIIKFLESEKRRRNTFLPVFLDIWYKPCNTPFLLCRTLVFGQSGRTRGPLLFFLGSVLLWAYPMYFLRVGLSSVL